MCLYIIHIVAILITMFLNQGNANSTDCSVKKTCEVCLSSSNECFWCNGDHQPNCISNPDGKLFPLDKCSFSRIKMKYCWVNYEVLVISLAVLAVLIVLTIIITICCCCRRYRRAALRRRMIVDDLTDASERSEREERNAQRRAEHNTRYDEIRLKYGLPRKNDVPMQYSRFENERD